MMLPIPRPEPLPLPAPAWLLQFLLLLTFVLHVLPMAAVLGGSLLTLTAELLGGRPAYRTLAERLSGLLPLAMPWAITLGVAPLLFVQLLYGSLFYSSSILMGRPWFAIVGLAIAAYYGMYAIAMAGQRLGRWKSLILVAFTLMIGTIAYTFTSNLTLMMQPERWLDLYRADPTGSAYPNLGAEQTARFLHAALGALSLAAGYVVLYSGLQSRGGEAPEWAEAGRRLGLTCLLLSLAGQAVVSPWYWSTLPAAERAALLAPPATLALAGLGPVLALVGLAGLWLGAPRRRDHRLWLWLGTVGMVGATAVQAVLRHLARQARLAPYLDPAMWREEPQWGLIAVFAVILLTGLALVTYLVVRFVQDSREAAGLGATAKQGAGETAQVR